jgi:hypothetical protein
MTIAITSASVSTYNLGGGGAALRLMIHLVLELMDESRALFGLLLSGRNGDVSAMAHAERGSDLFREVEFAFLPLDEGQQAIAIPSLRQVPSIVRQALVRSGEHSGDGLPLAAMRAVVMSGLVSRELPTVSRCDLHDVLLIPSSLLRRQLVCLTENEDGG